MTDKLNISNIEKIENFNVFMNDSKNENKKNVSIAAVDKYSSPLEAEVMISPWGQKHFRVTAQVINPLIGQNVYQKFFTFSSEEKAKETMNYIISVFNDIKDQAEVELKHSSHLIPQIWKKLSNLDCDIKYNDVIDNSIQLRFDNNQFDGKNTPQPEGYVGDLNNYPVHRKDVAPNIAKIVGIPTQLSSKKDSFIKTSSKKHEKLIVSNSILKLTRKTHSLVSLASDVKIENLTNTGTINFYVNDEQNDKNKEKKTVSIAAVDKYSSPLEAEVMISPWGQKHFRVTAQVTNPLIGQNVYQKFFTFSSKEKAKETMDYIVAVFNDLKDQAEIYHKHSAYLIPQLWKKLSDANCNIEYNGVVDNSIRKRFDNNQFDGKDSPEPQGWIGDNTYYPAHTKGINSEIAKIIGAPTQLFASKTNQLIKTNSLILKLIKKNHDNTI